MTPTPWPTQMTAWLEQAWLARYLDRQLSSEESTWFEAYVLDKPELLGTIEADSLRLIGTARGCPVRPQNFAM